MNIAEVLSDWANLGEKITPLQKCPLAQYDLCSENCILQEPQLIVGESRWYALRKG